MSSRAADRRFWWLDDGVPAPVRRAARDQFESMSNPWPLLADNECAQPGDREALEFWRKLVIQAHGGPMATDPGA